MTGSQTQILFPITAFAPGPFAGADASDPTWDLMDGWIDPLADRGAYGTPSLKKRIDDPDGPAVAFYSESEHDTACIDASSGRALIAGHASWRDYSVSCRLRLDQAHLRDMSEIRRDDGVFLAHGMAGVVLRMQTLRRYCFFCLEGNNRLVLYRRNDDDWHVLSWRRIAEPTTPITLTASVRGGVLEARCPELNITLRAEDDQLTHGLAGFRTLGASRLYDLRIEADENDTRINLQAQEQLDRDVAARGRDLPKAVHALTWECGRDELLQCTNFIHRDENHLLWATDTAVEARDWQGKCVWRHPEPVFRHGRIWNQIGPLQADGSRRLYLLTGTRQPGEKMAPGGVPASCPVADSVLILDGATGKPLARTQLPDDPASPGQLTIWDFSASVGFGQGDGEPDFIIRQWRRGIGNAGVDLWMYDRTGRLLWHRVTPTIFGHHYAVHVTDINRDGKLEVVAGGTVLDTAGNQLWVYQGRDIVDRLDGAGHHTPHYDAILCQDPSDWPQTQPLLFYVVGGAGIHIVDACDGAVRAVYPVGHAQGGLWCKVRPDLPGREMLVHNRWGTYGILTLISAHGEKLWSIQPDYVGELTRPVQWCAHGPQHIWVNTSEAGMGLYDGYGRMVDPLQPLRRVFAGKNRRQVVARPLERRPGGRHWMALRQGSAMQLFRPEDDAA